MDLFGSDNAAGLNCLILGSAAVAIERAASETAVDRVRLPLFGAKALGYDLETLRKIPEEVSLEVLARRVDVVFRLERGQASFLSPESGADSTLCLFSGGVDSTTGILEAKRSGADVTGVFGAHGDQSHGIAIVERLASTVLRRRGINIVKVPLPPLGAGGYVQTRGFLYVLAAGVLAARTGATKLLVTECGPTMFQPRFSPLDAVTMTTNPVILAAAERALTVLTAKPVRLLTPYRNLTKAEVMRRCPEPRVFRRTHSCISQRFGRHDGTCYGCVIRRLAAVAAAIPDARYDRNPIADKSAYAGNLLSLLGYCEALLLAPDTLEEAERERHGQFGTWDLFRRFSLDNFSALHDLATHRHRLRRDVRRIYQEVLNALGPRVFEDHLGRLREIPGVSE